MADLKALVAATKHPVGGVAHERGLLYPRGRPRARQVAPGNLIMTDVSPRRQPVQQLLDAKRNMLVCVVHAFRRKGTC